MKIEFLAQDSNLIAALDGAVATVRFDGSSEIVGVVRNHTSTDGFIVSTFSTFVQEFDLPTVIMTKDNPDIVFEIINESLEEFYATRSRGDHFAFVKKACETSKQLFDTSAGIHAAYWISKISDSPINEKNVEKAASMVTEARVQFYDYIRSIAVSN